MPDPFARALERADEDEQALDLAEHYHDRGLVPPLIFGRPVVGVPTPPPSGHGLAGALSRTGAGAPEANARDSTVAGSDAGSCAPVGEFDSRSVHEVREPGASGAGLA